MLPHFVAARIFLAPGARGEHAEDEGSPGMGGHRIVGRFAPTTGSQGVGVGVGTVLRVTGEVA